jgi:hypothetical protein
MSKEATVNLINKIKNNPDLLKKIDEKKLAALRTKINPYNVSICEQDTHFVAFSYTLPQYEYLVKQITVSLVGFLNSAVDEWNVPAGVPPVSVYDYVKNPKIVDEMTADWTKDEKVKEKLKKNDDFMKNRIVVKQFLEYLFQYDPNEHVRSAYSVPDPQEDRKEVVTPAAVLAIKEDTSTDRVRLLQDRRMQNLMNMAKSAQKGRPYSLARFNFLTDSRITQEQFRKFIGTDEKDINISNVVQEMIPPVDMFHNFKNYCDVNHEKIIEATDILYSELHDLNIAILPAFVSKSQQSVLSFIEKYKSEMTVPIYVAQTGKWTILESYKKNREVTDYVSKDSLLIKRMMEQRVKDAKTGKDMMEKQVKVKRKNHESEHGKAGKLVEKWQNFKKTQEGDDTAVGGIDLSSIVDDDDDENVELPIFRINKGGLSINKSKVVINTNDSAE